jgi:UrcA family protein
MFFSLRLPAALAISSCVLATVLVMPSVAVAAPPARVVHFSDLDLNKRAGVQALYRRLLGAAREVCGPAERTGTRIPSAERRACLAIAVKRAVQGVDQPLLTAYHVEQSEHGAQRRWTRTAASN